MTSWKTLTIRRRRLPVVLAAAALLALAGCGSTTETGSTNAEASDSAAQSDGATLTLTDGWVKAAPSGMTAMFGTLENESESDVTVTGGQSTAAGMVELHEVVTVDGESIMQPKESGFLVPAGGTYELAPGHDHIMLMNLPAPIEPGDQVEVTLDLSDGGTVTVSGPAKEFAAGNEDYQPSPGSSTEMDDSMEPSSSSGGSS